LPIPDGKLHRIFEVFKIFKFFIVILARIIIKILGKSFKILITILRDLYEDP